MNRRSKYLEKILFSAALMAATAFVLPASAQEATDGSNYASGTGKGIVGGALLGAELPMLGMAIGGVNSTWPYIVFGAAGAVGGGLGGYVLEQETSSDVEGSAGQAGPPLILLAGGMALVIPTLVATLNATAYDPGKEEEGFDEMDQAGGDEEKPAAPNVKGAADLRLQSRRPTLPFSLLGVTERGVSPGIPAVQLRRTFTDRELIQFGATQRTEVHMPLLGGTF